MVLDMLKKELTALWRPLLIIAEITMLSAIFVSYAFPAVCIVGGIVLLLFAIKNDIETGHWEQFKEQKLPLKYLVLEKYLLALLVMVGQLIIYAAGFQTMLQFGGPFPRIPFIFVVIFLFAEMVLIGLHLHTYFIKGPRAANSSFYYTFLFGYIKAIVILLFILIFSSGGGFSQYFNNYPVISWVLSAGIFVATYFLSKKNIYKFDFYSLKEEVTPKKQMPVKYIVIKKRFIDTILPSDDEDELPLVQVPLKEKAWEARSFEDMSRKKHPILDKIIIFVGLLYFVFVIMLIVAYYR